jgi:hypothetical protein
MVFMTVLAAFMPKYLRARVCPDGKEGHAFQIAMDTSLNVLGKTVKGR